ncbi:MAG: 4Fe-4S binding protein, partial [Pseudomonadota bacterium]
KLFYDFFKQYRGHSISDTLVVGSPYGAGSEGSALVYLDGVTKATASVRIAHESVLAATLAVAREKMQGVSTGPPAYPNLEYKENLNWQKLVEQGIAKRKVVLNRDVDDAFEGTIWEDDDPEATDEPDAPYLDLWVIDLGPPSIAEAVLDADSLEELRAFQTISTNDEPILLVETGRHGLVSEDFVRNTAPDWISAEQSGLPVAMRDADLFVELSDTVPPELQDGVAMILRTDRRLGFDPANDWTLNVLAVREHGVFQPEIGSVTLSVEHKTDERFFVREKTVEPMPAWREAIHNRQGDLIAASFLLVGLSGMLFFRNGSLATSTVFTPLRLGILALVVAFVGWWGQGQLSIVTVLGVIRTAVDGGTFAFLLYDPFSLLIWAFAIIGFVVWGRALFCGWLCPFGALQEFAHHLGRLLRLPQWQITGIWDDRLKLLKYGLLAGLVVTVFVAPGSVDKVAEIEPFKTAITVYFVREWYYVAYAVAWLALGMVFFKGFCRYVCPLGAIMALGGLLRGRNWIERRVECGSPCQLCKVKCSYGAIKKSGAVSYSECFGCLDCVTIHNDREKCVPSILAERKGKALVTA